MQFIANQARLPGDFLDNSISELNGEEHLPIEPQDEGVLLDDVDLGTGEDTRCDDGLPEPRYL